MYKRQVQCAAFGVPTGQVFGLLGANGAGKTTTVSMICRSIEPTSGDAKVGGRSVLAEFEQAARALGVVNCVEINQCVGCTRQFFTKLSRRRRGRPGSVERRGTGIATPSSRRRVDDSTATNTP